MNKAQIIDVIAKDGEYVKACKSIAKNNYLADDLYQELMIILLEYNEEKLILIWEQKRIKWFIISILLKMCHSNTSPFYAKIRKFGEKSDDSIDFDELEDEEIKISKEIPDVFEILELTDEELIETEDGYAKSLLKMSVELGSVQKVSNATGIPYLSVWLSINNYKKKIKIKYGKV